MWIEASSRSRFPHGTLSCFDPPPDRQTESCGKHGRGESAHRVSDHIRVLQQSQPSEDVSPVVSRAGTVITHQRQTMEVADTLYGVTLESDGTSRVLSRRLVKAKGA